MRKEVGFYKQMVLKIPEHSLGGGITSGERLRQVSLGAAYVYLAGAGYAFVVGVHLVPVG